ncbi:helix-turn-helix domain-containing protein [Mycobacterium sp. TJFP1]
MIERVNGVLLEPDDARYLLDALDALLTDRRPSPRLADFIARLRKTSVKADVSAPQTDVDVREVGNEEDSPHDRPYDLVTTGEAAAILRLTPGGVRDLARRGSIPAYRAGGRWVYPARSVVALAEQRAAKRS